MSTIETLIQEEIAFQEAAKPNNGPSKSAIDAFGNYDYERLVNMRSTDVMKIENIRDENLSKIALLLQALIRKGKLHMMDKEDGSAWSASVVIGYNNGGLLIAHER